MRIKRTLATAALASTLVLAGCSDDGDGDEDDASTGDAASETTPTDDETEDDETEDVDPGSDDADVAEFLADFEEGLSETTSARMTMEIDAQGQALDVEGAVDYTSDPPNMAMQMSGGQFGGEDIEMRIVDGSVYMNLGASSQNKFFELSLDQLGAQAGVGDITEQLDPNAQLETFEEGLTEVELLGEEEIEGESTDHYRLVIDTTKVEELAEAPGMGETLEIEMWLDDENRAVQTVSSLGGLGEVQANFFDFGADVDVKKPAPSEIVSTG